MPKDITLPGIGKVPENKAVLAAGGIVAAGIAVFVIRRRASAKAVAATASTTAPVTLVSDPAGNTCTALDPNSGYCTGSPEDTAYHVQASSPSGDYSGNGGSSFSTSLDTLILSNAQWAAAALPLLPGGNDSANQTALANVLGGMPVTPTQQAIFENAITLVRIAPPHGYPPITLTGPVPVPVPVPVPTSAKWAYHNPPGLTASVASPSTVRLSWGVPTATVSGKPAPKDYTVAVFRGNTKIRQNIVAGTSYDISGLPKRGLLSVEVWANGAPVAPDHSTVFTANLG